MAKKIYISVLFVIIGFKLALSQERNTSFPPTFGVKVTVVDERTNKPIKNATVSVNGKVFSYGSDRGVYAVRARAGDELVVTHPDFETVFYTIKDDEDIKVLVRDFDISRRRGDRNYRNKQKTTIDSKVPISKKLFKPKKVDLFNTYLDSAKYYKRISIDKSLSFIQNILSTKESVNRNAATYSTLADIYMYWKQYDLAITNYKASLNFLSKISTKVLLARAQFLFKKYQEAEQSYLELLLVESELRNFEKVEVYEGIGDVSFALKDYPRAHEYYTKSLAVAERIKVLPKITDLNSKLGDVLAAQGNIAQARGRFANSLNLASKENVVRSIKEKDKVADFFNENNQFDDEIQLRKESLKEAITIINDSINSIKVYKDSTSIVDGLGNVLGLKNVTPQAINYKIGRAYTQKEDYVQAIPYLQNSINVPESVDDIEIKKDATRKLSETFAAVGDYDKALKTYQDYVKLVDQIYIKKGQEINNAQKFGQTLADNQNRIAILEKNKELSDNLIELAAKDQQLSEERNRNQLILIYSLAAGLIGLIAVVSLLFRSNRQQKLANNLLALKSMRSQMNPHFIFNALNSVNSFIAVNDERNANRYLSEFSVLMRSVLENSDEDFIPLSKEIELLELYVKLEHNRFKDKFNYTIDIDKQIDLDQFSIPPMLLQPYIENAIWHGLRYKKEIGNLSISISQKDTDTVRICIQDDGVGRKKSMALKTKNQLKQKSKGMSTIKNRVAILNDMYEDRISVQVSDVFDNGEGTKVELLLRKN